MAIVLGIPKVAGNSDVIESKALSGGTAIGAGKLMKVHTDGAFKECGNGDVPYAVSGRTTYSTIEGVISGLEVGVRIPTGETPAIGGQVYVKDADLTIAAQSGEGYTAINATFASAKDSTAIDPNTGLAIADVVAIMINFAGGL